MVRVSRGERRQRPLQCRYKSLRDHPGVARQLIKKILLISVNAPTENSMFRAMRGAGIDLQYLDSRIAENLIETFTAQGIPILTVHDSYIVPENHAFELRQEMQKQWALESKLKVSNDMAFEDWDGDTTSIVQLGYVDELENHDPQQHQEILDMKISEHVSESYYNRLNSFRAWLSEKDPSNG